MPSKMYAVILICLAALVSGAGNAPAAGSTLMFTNSLDKPILAIRVMYETPSEGPRPVASDVSLPPGGEYRLGVQGATLPQRIILDLPLESYDFDELSGLALEETMQLEVTHEEGAPRLKRIGGDAAVRGIERRYFTAENRASAVDWEELIACATMDEVRALVTAKAAAVSKEQGELKRFDIEAGPIWDHAYALKHCPSVAREWSSNNTPLEARWTGAWSTIEPGKMSVCTVVTGAAPLKETLFEENAGWGPILHFPVDWMREAQASVLPVDPQRAGEGIIISLTSTLPDEAPIILNTCLYEMRTAGYRPLAFRLKAEAGQGGESGSANLNFLKGESDILADRNVIREHLTAVVEKGNRFEGEVICVEGEVFDKKRKGENPQATRAVVVRIAAGLLAVNFIPDGSHFLSE